MVCMGDEGRAARVSERSRCRAEPQRTPFDLEPSPSTGDKPRWQRSCTSRRSFSRAFFTSRAKGRVPNSSSATASRVRAKRALCNRPFVTTPATRSQPFLFANLAAMSAWRSAGFGGLASPPPSLGSLADPPPTLGRLGGAGPRAGGAGVGRAADGMGGPGRAAPKGGGGAGDRKSVV